jgi:hypothetical protein
VKFGQKVILIITAFVLVVGIGATYYLFNKPHRNIALEKPAYILGASILFKEFNMNKDLGDEKFGNQVIQVSGRVAEVSVGENSVSIILNNMMEAVNCTIEGNYNESAKGIHFGDSITVKGKCDGFDMIMGVVLTKCILIE